MFCPNCGKEIPNKSKFCPVCGTFIEPDEPVVRKKRNGGRRQSPNIEPDREFADTRWPKSIGVLSCFYLFFYLLQTVFSGIQYSYSVYTGVEYSFGLPAIKYIMLFLVSLVPFLFFVHTKKLAFLTAIPMLALAVINVISVINSLSNTGVLTTGGLSWGVLSIFFSVVPVILYLIQMIVKPSNSVLCILYLILSILGIVGLGILSVLVTVEMMEFLADVDGNYFYIWSIIGEGFGIIAQIFATIAYSIAMFNSRKKRTVVTY